MVGQNRSFISSWQPGLGLLRKLWRMNINMDAFILRTSYVQRRTRCGDLNLKFYSD